MSVLTSRHPDLGLRIKPGLTVTLLAEIERGNLDAALTSQPHQMPENMQFRPLVKEPMQLITALEEPIDDPIMLLKSRPFIRFDRTAVVGALIDNWILSKRIDVDETMELDSPEAITGMVQANLGVSIVPDLAVKPDDGALVKRISLGADAPTRTLGLIYRADQVKNHAIDAVFSALSDVISAPAE
jgi:DNA-binding transcriptional LysR family regulator